MVLKVEPAIAPGLMLQFPAGKPLNSTLPEASVQVGCIIEPTNGADGVTGCTLMTISADANEVHPSAL